MKIAVFYYTQSGQALRVAQSICKPFEEDVEDAVIYKKIVPLEHYPFPWDKDIFFDTFPETRLCMPPSGIQPIDFSDVEDADMVIVVGQSWFLSPSLPIQSFFTDAQVKRFLGNRPVVFVNACRNMWLMTSRKVKEYIQKAGAHLMGHIVMQDEAPNLISVITIMRWLVNGKKEGTKFLPPAGVSNGDISKASRFGTIIKEKLNSNGILTLQQELLAAGAIHYKPFVLFMEKTGHRMFGLWARFIRRKGGFRSPERQPRVRLFYRYLFFVLFIISPFGWLCYHLTYPLHQIKKNEEKDCQV